MLPIMALTLDDEATITNTYAQFAISGLVLWQFVLILGSRFHYTEDIIIASMLCWAAWKATDQLPEGWVVASKAPKVDAQKNDENDAKNPQNLKKEHGLPTFLARYTRIQVDNVLE